VGVRWFQVDAYTDAAEFPTLRRKCSVCCIYISKYLKIFTTHIMIGNSMYISSKKMMINIILILKKKEMISNAIFKSIIFKYFKKLSTERLEEPTGQLNRLTI